MTQDVQKYGYIDAIRGYAVLGVLLVHSSKFAAPISPALALLMDSGARGVQLFYIASAWTLFMSWEFRRSHEIHPVRNFFIRRFFRIAPIFYVAIICYVLLHGFSTQYWAPNGMEWWYVPLTALFLNGFNPETISSVVPGGWSIAVEMNFYLILPLLLRYVATTRRLAIFFVSSIALYLIVSTLVIPYVFASRYPSNQQYLISNFIFLNFFGQLPVFAIGLLGYSASKNRDTLARWLGLGSIVFFAIIASIVLMPFSQKVPVSQIIAGYGAVLLALLLSRYQSWVLVNRPIILIGKISFSMYLIHWGVLEAFSKSGISATLGNGDLSSICHYAGVVATTALLSYLTYTTIERKGILVGKQLIDRLERRRIRIRGTMDGVRSQPTGGRPTRRVLESPSMPLSYRELGRHGWSQTISAWKTWTHSSHTRMLLSRNSEAQLSIATSKEVRVVVVGQTPPPFHGQSIMIDKMLQARISGVKLFHVRMGFSRDFGEMKRFRLRKVWELLRIIYGVARVRLLERAHILYYPPSGPDLLPVLRDIAILCATRWMFRKTIFHFHAGGLLEIYPCLPSVLKPLFKVAFTRPDVGIRLSPFSPEDPRGLHAIREFIVPNGAEDPSSLGITLPNRGRNRGLLQILFVGMISESKGASVLIQAAGILKSRNVDFRMKIVGRFASADFEREIKACIERLDLRDECLLVGQLTGTEKFKVFSEADIFCFPSWYEAESFPVVLVEAMSFGLPIVSTRWRGIPSLVDDGVNGFLVEPRNAQDISDKLELLARGEDLRQRMGETGRTLFLNNFTMNHHLQRMQAVFEFVGSGVDR